MRNLQITTAALIVILTACAPSSAPTEPTEVVVPSEPEPVAPVVPSTNVPSKNVDKVLAPVAPASILSFGLQAIDSTGMAAVGRLGDRVLCQVNMSDGSVAAYSWSVNGEKIAGADSQALELSKTDVRFKMRPTVTCHAGDRTESMTVVDTASVVDWGRFDCYLTNADGTRGALTFTGRATMQNVDENDSTARKFDFCAVGFIDVDGDEFTVETPILAVTPSIQVAQGQAGTLHDTFLTILSLGAGECIAFTPKFTAVAGGVKVEMIGETDYVDYQSVGNGICYWSLAIKTHDGAVYGTIPFNTAYDVDFNSIQATKTLLVGYKY